jgi:LysR family transcriptional regulator for bpeEF and oprC
MESCCIGEKDVATHNTFDSESSMLLDSLQAVTIFVRVAETGNFTEAARRLNMSSSGISKSLSRLEGKLGVRLFTRTTRSIHLTDEGRMLLEQYRQVLADVEQAEAMLSQRLGTPSGRVRLQVPVGFGRRIIMPLLAELSRQYPDLSFDIELNGRTADPAEEGLDAAVRIGPPPSDSRLIARKMCDIRFVAVASPDYIRRKGQPKAPEELQNHQCLAYYEPQTGRYHEWNFVSADGRRFVKAFPGKLNVNNAQALMHAAIGGAGIALVARFHASDAINSGQLKIVLSDFVSSGPSVWLLYGEKRYQLPRVRTVVEFLLTRVAIANM